MARQINVSFPDDVRERLEGAAEAARHSIAEEIRTRVDRTFAEEQMDPRMRELLALIVRLDESLQSDLKAAWHADTGVHQAFAAGVAQLAADFAPVDYGGAANTLLGSGVYGDDAAAVGRTHARLVQRGDSYPNLEAAKQARSKSIGERARHIRKKGE